MGKKKKRQKKKGIEENYRTTFSSLKYGFICHVKKLF